MMATIKLCECGCGQPAPIATKTNLRRGRVKGQPSRFRQGHHFGAIVRAPDFPRPHVGVTKDYRRIGSHGPTQNTQQMLHRVRAERALGKPLPPQAVVHHADGSIDERAPLVICENQAYHALLHRRMRIKAAGGNPNTDRICCGCRFVKPVGEFHKGKYQAGGLSMYCRACDSARKRAARQRDRAS